MPSILFSSDRLSPSVSVAVLATAGGTHRVFGPRPCCRCRCQPWLTSPRVGAGGQQRWLCTPGYRQPPNRTVWAVYTGLQTATKPNSVGCVHRAIDSHQTKQSWTVYTGLQTATKPNSVDCVHRATDSHPTELCWLCTPGYRQPPNRTVLAVYTGLQTTTKPNSVGCVHRATDSHQTEQCWLCTPGYRQPPNRTVSLSRARVDTGGQYCRLCAPCYRQKRKEKRERRYLVPVTAVASVLTWDCRWAVDTGVCIALTAV